MASIRPHLDMLRGSLDPWHCSAQSQDPRPSWAWGNGWKAPSPGPRAAMATWLGVISGCMDCLSAAWTKLLSQLLPSKGPFITQDPPAHPRQQQSGGLRPPLSRGCSTGHMTPTYQSSPCTPFLSCMHSHVTTNTSVCVLIHLSPPPPVDTKRGEAVPAFSLAQPLAQRGLHKYLLRE